MLANIQPTTEFIYQPPETAKTAKKILIKPNLGYPVPHPVTVSINILKKVLDALRLVNPEAEIFIVEGVCSTASLTEIATKNGLYSILDQGMYLLDADELPLTEYPNLSPKIVRYSSMLAPSILGKVDCRISVSAFKRTELNAPLISASLKNLYGLFPRKHYQARSPKSRGQLHRPSVPEILQDVYFTIGHLFDGGVVDGTQKFISKDWRPDVGSGIKLGQVCWGDNLLAVDRLICQEGGESIPSYIEAIEKLIDSHNNR